MTPAQGAGVTSLRVLAFNLCQLPRGLHPGAKRARAEAAEATIRRVDPDVLLLAEAFSAQAADLLARLADRWPHRTPLVGRAPVGSTANRRITWFAVSGGAAVLSRHPMTERHQVVFASSYWRTTDFLANKGAALVRLLVRDRPIWMLGTHLQADEGPGTRRKAHRVRLAQLAEVRGLITRHVPATEPVVVGGDLNIEHRAGRSRPDGLGRGQLEQAEAVLGAALATVPAGEFTFDARTNPLAAKSVGDSYRDSLDYLGTLRGGNRPRVEVGPVRLVRYDGDTIPSDHYPVVAEIEY
ncbi:sphingomyelin phosphodiesterase [Amycolatopsis anabasis]|uniref:sphingomyelin phosphodiesterase n=1 Tax=Amycolatopsis anabasis TaxID=1840409 RepID=UPI00131AC989|nr:sphingomyelin phosphodiesterase [Amycolatopsis anabasis]